MKENFWNTLWIQDLGMKMNDYHQISITYHCLNLSSQFILNTFSICQLKLNQDDDVSQAEMVTHLKLSLVKLNVHCALLMYNYY